MLAQSRGFLAKQIARNAIFGAENLLSSDICPRTLFVPRSEQFSYSVARRKLSYEGQIMSKDKYPSTFSPQMEPIVFIILQIFFATRAALKIKEYLKIRPVARKGYGSIANEAKTNGLLTCGP